MTILKKKHLSYFINNEDRNVFDILMENKLDESSLRELAKKRIEGNGLVYQSHSDDVRKLVEELIIHQEELRIQNEELLRIQVELEVSRARYFELYDLAPVGYLMLTPELIIKEANLAASRLLVTDRKNLINRRLSTFVAPTSQESLHLHYRLLDNRKEKQVSVFHIPVEMGNELQVQFESNRVETGLNTGFRSILTDVTEKRLTEEALFESESKYRSLFNNLREAVSYRRLIFDGKGEVVDAEIIDVNAAALVGMGNLSTKDIIGQKITEIFSPKMAKRSLGCCRKMLAASKPISEVVQFDFNGRFYLTTHVPVGIEHYIVTSVDVTDQKDLEMELKRSNEDLQQFANVASHDLKEPLRMVTSYLHLLEKRNGDRWDEESKDYMHYAMNGALRMKVIIEDLLAYARVTTNGKPFTAVDMDEVIAIVLNDLKFSIEESQADVTANNLPSVNADKLQMVLLLENLISNSIKYRNNARPVVLVTAHDGGDSWIISVKDNGIGIDPRYADRIFQMFQRLHTVDQYPGTGIGLAIAKKIVERHGGRIWVESVEGKGATFLFTIPKIRVN